MFMAGICKSIVKGFVRVKSLINRELHDNSQLSLNAPYEDSMR